MPHYAGPMVCLAKVWSLLLHIRSAWNDMIIIIYTAACPAMGNATAVLACAISYVHALTGQRDAVLVEGSGGEAVGPSAQYLLS